MSDSNIHQRKADHISLAFDAQFSKDGIDHRFYFEPVLSGIPVDNRGIQKKFLDFEMEAPMWVSSMTGGTKLAQTINKLLAEACGEYKLGMGLGSCRVLLTSDQYLEDFNVRKYMPGRPLFANLGIAQVSQLLENGQRDLADKLVLKLKADGLIIHVNPLQEYLQPEGDVYTQSPLEIMERFLEKAPYPVIVKEVGQGFGPESLRKMLKMPFAAIDFGASGGTNFSLLELLRSESDRRDQLLPLASVGHSAEEMVGFVNAINEESQCNQLIISGGIKNFLDGYYLMQKSKMPSIFGQASGFLKHALEGKSTLHQYIENQISGLRAASAFLKIKN